MHLPTKEDRAAGRAPIGFLVFLSLMTSVVALTIDAILPALDGISDDLGFADPSDRQLLIFAVFVGMGLAQPVFGPLSDAIGRRWTATIGWVIYGIGTVIAMTAPGLTTILIGRFLQGVGAAGPRVVATAIVRDLYDGRPMARIISLVMTVFMLVPMIAPLIGQQMEFLGGWRAIFILYLAMGCVCVTIHLGLIPETLTEENRRPLSFAPLARAFSEALTTKTTMLYTLASAAIFGAFAAMLGSAQQVFEELLGLGDLFPLAFASVALMIAVAQFLNSRLVMRFGMRFLSRVSAVIVVIGGSVSAVLTITLYGEIPSLWLFLLTMAPVFIGSGLMFSNLTALALEPLGHIAGTASAVVMSVSSLLAVPLGIWVASLIDGTVVPLLWGFAGFGALTLVFILAADWVRQGERKGEGQSERQGAAD
ncbi:MAG: multidrug effflux MFS transporter [Pseudomonadota bacterium]